MVRFDWPAVRLESRTVSEDSRVVDIVVVGGGPVGLFGAFYAGLRGMSVRIVDSLAELGGQLVALYPEKYIYDSPGHPKILAKDLARLLIEQAMFYKPEVFLGEQVRGLEYDEIGQFYRLTTTAREHRARTLLIAAGAGALDPRRLTLPNASAYEGRGLHYVVREPDRFAGRRILIVGGGDSAVDWANHLAPLASSLTLAHRRDVFRAHEESVAQMKRGPTRLLLFHELVAIEGDAKVERAILQDNRSKDRLTLEVDDILVNIGFQTSLGPLKDWGLTLERSQIRVDSSMNCGLPGVFASGDVAAYEGKIKLIATGYGEAAIAVNHAKHYLDPAARVFPGYSSDLPRQSG